MTKLTRKSAGHYESQDGRWVIKDKYDPSGPAHVREGRNSSIRWCCRDTKLNTVHYNSTLSECREHANRSK